MTRYVLAVDVGGTFTDLVLCELETGAQRVHKTPSTPDDPSVGFLRGLNEILDAAGAEPAQVVHILHGTTIATNSVLERKGAPVGLLVTTGYKYVLEIARHGTPGWRTPTPGSSRNAPCGPGTVSKSTNAPPLTAKSCKLWTRPKSVAPPGISPLPASPR